MEALYVALLSITVLAAIILILMVLVQKSKGGGLASGFSSSNQIMGVRKTTDFVEKATWGLAVAIVVLSLVSTMMLKDYASQSGDSTPNIETQAIPSLTTPDVNTDLPMPAPAESAPAQEVPQN
ncbi:preprotein translocase subunit SecG [Dysgonomonas sp. 216]|uniref:preprotein translocase subunit SecG n=1 Tax=Dysgonomonas sp. 216 TaxID=2302934 RepID=UPI0013D5EE5C|nr:preprotein translocase subunit SecG [Dysgonomonas sp. 216]NDW18394.1 preprotein translocase subunit SecG [Dysgonomonas sp. 216]